MHLTGFYPEGTQREKLGLVMIEQLSEPQRPGSDVNVRLQLRAIQKDKKIIVFDGM